MSAIKIKNLSVKVGKDFHALKRVNVDLPEGKIVGFIGPSGAGKTTLIRTIVGRQKIDKGSIHIFDIPAGSPKLRSQMSYMTQEVSVYPDLTVRQNLNYFATMFGMKRAERRAAIDELLHIVDLKPQAGQMASSLSGGQKQRTSLAIALIGYPKLMVLDEPTVGLDPVLREQLWLLFKELAKKGTTLIVSSHVMDEAERCEDLMLLRDGKLVAHGSPKELCEQTGSSSVEESFLKFAQESA